jgi:hypothetical protein
LFSEWHFQFLLKKCLHWRTHELTFPAFEFCPETNRASGHDSDRRKPEQKRRGDMRKLVFLAMFGIALSLLTGCANGPFQRWFRGAPCNSCNPPFGKLFQRGENTMGTCSTGTCSGVTTLDSTMSDGQNFGNGYYNATPDPGAIGSGSTNSVPSTTDSYPYPTNANRPSLGAGFDGYINPPK